MAAVQRTRFRGQVMWERMPWGKHRGKVLSDVPASYLAWMLEEAENLDAWLERAARRELKRRFDLVDDPAPCERCNHLGREWPGLYRKLAMVAHPDRGGDTETMQVVNRLNDLVRASA